MKQSTIDNPIRAKTSNASPMKDSALQQEKISSRRNLRFPWLGKRHTLTAWLAKQLEETRPKGAIASLDGVRAIACLIVIAYHISLMARDTHLWTVQGHPITTAVVLSGGAGVTLFFVLSGFLLFLPYAKALLFEQPWPGARLFYLRRVLRIIPGYYFSLVLLVLFSQSQYLQPQRWGQLLLFPLFLMDSSQKTFQQLNGPYWTLAIEWQYYLLLPLIALGILCVVRWIRPEKRFWTIVACLLGVIGWGLFTRSWGDYLIAHPTATVLVPRSILNPLLFVVYGTHGKYLEDFAVGMLVGLVYTTARDPARAGSTRWLYRLSPWLWGIGILLLLWTSMQNYSLSFHYAWPVLPAFFKLPGWLHELEFSLGFGCCILAVLFDGGALQRFFGWTPLRWIGLISFSLYIWHLPLLIAFFKNIAPSLAGQPRLLVYSLYWVWAAVVVIPFSCGVYLLVEKPGIQLSNRLRSQMAAKRKPEMKPGEQERVDLAPSRMSHS